MRNERLSSSLLDVSDSSNTIWICTNIQEQRFASLSALIRSDTEITFKLRISRIVALNISSELVSPSCNRILAGVKYLASSSSLENITDPGYSSLVAQISWASTLRISYIRPNKNLACSNTLKIIGSDSLYGNEQRNSILAFGFGKSFKVEFALTSSGPCVVNITCCIAD